MKRELQININISQHKINKSRYKEKLVQSKLFPYELEIEKRQMEQERRSRELQNKMK